MDISFLNLNSYAPMHLGFPKHKKHKGTSENGALLLNSARLPFDIPIAEVPKYGACLPAETLCMQPLSLWSTKLVELMELVPRAIPVIRFYGALCLSSFVVVDVIYV